jgi:hypothetical protein
MSSCHVANQISAHCDEDTTYCPECDSWMEEKTLIDGSHWLECVNQQCGETIDLNKEDDYE